MSRKAIVVAGPTASGKSALALRVAEAFDGLVVNADSMQVYQTLSILTARPGPAEQARAPHRLYGILPPEALCSAGRWRGLAVAECEAAWREGKLPIVVGGTGLYLRALVDGLSPVPEVPDDVRANARGRFAEMGNLAFHALLAQHDPVMGARLHPGNSQRLVRAWEVLQATGRSLAEWQAEPPVDRLAADVATIVLVPPSETLYAACDRRFLEMVDRGAVEEVGTLRSLGLDRALPSMKALGVAELAAHLRGEISLQQAVAAAQRATRNYAKRQLTWFRHQMRADYPLPAQFSESFLPKILSFIRQFLLTKP